MTPHLSDSFNCFPARLTHTSLLLPNPAHTFHVLPISFTQIKAETILATLYQKEGDYDQPWDPDVHFAVSDDFFTSFSTHVRCGNMFEVIGR